MSKPRQTLKILGIVLILVGLFIKHTYSQETRTIHVFVALCDNLNQGIVPVPKKLGNGEEARNNLYWGAMFGVKSYFKNSGDWEIINTVNHPSNKIIERILFKHKSSNTYLLADAYRGIEIKTAIKDFLISSIGDYQIKIKHDSSSLEFGGKSQLLAYVGHDGLMDFNLDLALKPKNSEKKEVIILACFSKEFFNSFIEDSGAYPLVWTTGLMAPEAYTLKSAIDGWILNESNEQIRERTAQAYNKYQKCGLRGARNLFATDF